MKEKKTSSIHSQRSGKEEVVAANKAEVDSDSLDVERQAAPDTPAIGQRAAILLFIGYAHHLHFAQVKPRPLLSILSRPIYDVHAIILLSRPFVSRLA